MFDWIKKLKPVDGLLVLGLVLVIIGLGMGWSGKFEKQTKVELVKKEIKPTNDIQVISKVTFDVGGAVVKPGVYSLDGSSRINEALVVAGGLSAEADRDWVEKNINKAEVIRDGMKMYIPKIGESESPKSQKSESIKGTMIVNLNTAGIEELDTLPGIGLAIAGRIVDYREKNRGFRNIEELKLVSGIGEKLFEKIREMISL